LFSQLVGWFAGGGADGSGHDEFVFQAGEAREGMGVEVGPAHGTVRAVQAELFHDPTRFVPVYVAAAIGRRGTLGGVAVGGESNVRNHSSWIATCKK
jgi:hypothetical protein